MLCILSLNDISAPLVSWMGEAEYFIVVCLNTLVIENMECVGLFPFIGVASYPKFINCTYREGRKWHDSLFYIDNGVKRTRVKDCQGCFYCIRKGSESAGTG